MAADAGAKVLLVGDWAQLQSVDAGGAFTLLASARPDTPELTEVHRFTNEWERLASLELRFGRTEVIGTYVRHDRVREGTTAEMIDAAYAAWRADVRAGLASVLVTEATQSVIELNQRARAERLLDGDTIAGREVNLADGTRASEGDLVITRSNDRRLRTLRGGWVRNGDRWRVAEVSRDGSVRVERLGVGIGGGVTLPAAYVAEHVDLGYAVTAHRAQGITVDTSHVVVSGTTTRENLYVSMTRGRDSNVAYVALDKPDDSHAAPEDEEVTAKTVLYGVLQHSGAELSAHQTIEAEQERWSSIAQVAAEYETIAAVAQRDRWIGLLEGCGLTDEQVEQVLASDSFGPLTAELRRAEANHHDVERLLPKLVARRSLDDAEDVGRRPDQPTPARDLASEAREAARRGEAHRWPDPRRRGPDDRGDGRRPPRAAGPDRVAGARPGRSRRRAWRTLAQAARRAAAPPLLLASAGCTSFEPSPPTATGTASTPAPRLATIPAPTPRSWTRLGRPRRSAVPGRSPRRRQTARRGREQ